MSKKASLKQKNLVLAKQLINLCKKDQKMRKKWADNNFSAEFYDEKMDKKHTRSLKNIVQEYGWPTKDMVGQGGAEAAWVLLQHANTDPKFQKECLKKIKDLPKGIIKPLRIAQTEDRLRLNEGKKQLYGTSFVIDLKSGKLSSSPIHDPKNVERRRKALGLDSFVAHKKRAVSSYKEYKEKLAKNK